MDGSSLRVSILLASSLLFSFCLFLFLFCCCFWVWVSVTWHIRWLYYIINYRPDMTHWLHNRYRRRLVIYFHHPFPLPLPPPPPSSRERCSESENHFFFFFLAKRWTFKRCNWNIFSLFSPSPSIYPHPNSLFSVFSSPPTLPFLYPWARRFRIKPSLLPSHFPALCHDPWTAPGAPLQHVQYQQPSSRPSQYSNIACGIASISSISTKAIPSSNAFQPTNQPVTNFTKSESCLC